MEINCVVLKEFNVPGGTYQPGRKLNLNAVLLEKWVDGGFVRKYKPRKRSIKMKTVVTT